MTASARSTATFEQWKHLREVLEKICSYLSSTLELGRFALVSSAFNAVARWRFNREPLVKFLQLRYLRNHEHVQIQEAHITAFGLGTAGEVLVLQLHKFLWKSSVQSHDTASHSDQPILTPPLLIQCFDSMHDGEGDKIYCETVFDAYRAALANIHIQGGLFSESNHALAAFRHYDSRGRRIGDSPDVQLYMENLKQHRVISQTELCLQSQRANAMQLLHGYTATSYMQVVSATCTTQSKCDWKVLHAEYKSAWNPLERVWYNDPLNTFTTDNGNPVPVVYWNGISRVTYF
jgi:hypothetical protein